MLKNTGMDPEICMWVHEETVNGMKLTEIINTQHENVKYLPGKKLSPNVVAIADLLTACTGRIVGDYFIC